MREPEFNSKSTTPVPIGKLIPQISIEEIAELIEEANDCANNEWEINFAGDMASKLKQYDEKIFLSPRQLYFLKKIAGRHY